MDEGKEVMSFERWNESEVYPVKKPDQVYFVAKTSH
jgi:hypothetical protein